MTCITVNAQQLMSWDLALELDDCWIKNGLSESSKDDLMAIISSFDYFQTFQAKERLLKFFQFIPKEEVLYRTKAITKLSNLLNCVKLNKRN